MICESKTPMPRLLDSVTNNSICSNSVPANNIFFRIQNLMKVFFKFQLGFPMGRESLVSWDKGTEVSSLSRDKGTAMGQPRDSHRIRGTEGKKSKKLQFLGNPSFNPKHLQVRCYTIFFTNPSFQNIGCK